MVFLRSFYIFIFLLLSQDSYSFIIKNIHVTCENTSNCQNYEEALEPILGKDVSEIDVLNKIKSFSYDPTLKSLTYKIAVSDKDETHLFLNVVKKLRVGEIEIVNNTPFDSDHLIVEDEIKQLIQIKEGTLFSRKNENLTEKTIEKYFSEKGVNQYDYELVSTIENNLLNYSIVLNIKSYIKIRKINILGSDSIERNQIYFSPIISKFKNQNLDKLNLKLATDAILTQMNENGYYFSTLKTEFKSIDDVTTDVNLLVDFGPQVSFLFNGLEHFSRQEILRNMRESLKTDMVDLNEESVKNLVLKEFKNAGVYNTQVKIRKESGISKTGDKFLFFFIKVKEGNKLKIQDISFNGIEKVSYEELMNLYYENSNILIERGFLDQEYISNFQEKIKKFYLNKGYLFVTVSEPKIEFNKNNEEVKVSYDIKEFRQTVVEDILLPGLQNKIEKSKLLANLSNEIGKEFKVIDLEKDLEKLMQEIKSEGYFFAKYKSLAEKDVLKYNKDFSKVTILASVDLNELSRLRNVIISGHEETKKYVISREVKMDEGGLITPQFVSDTRTRLGALGLFSSIKISPSLDINVKDTKLPNTDLIIHVTEKDFGLGEVSLGYRTDFGIRAALGINYNNLAGRNWTLSTKIESNYRLNLGTLDQERRNLDKRFIEWDANAGILFPYMGNWPVRSEISTGHKRQRFRSFDAKIFTLQMQESVDFSRAISFSIKYQLDTVEQFDAINEDFNDQFQIGSITPSLSLDFRDNPLRPRAGAYFGLSWETANPNLFSNNDKDLVVDFDKITMRNKFYYPFNPNYGLALSLSLGKEVNNATEPLLDENGNKQYDNGTLITKGYIPSIRVFRLDGRDTVRGFTDTEINRLDSGEDISSVAIRDRAYFVNMKFEIRNFINDLMIAGLFVDAGRIYANKFNPLDLRTSFGATFKFVTPVGSLDFDYGIKFRRLVNDDGQQEGFGRFHLSIGFF